MDTKKLRQKILDLAIHGKLVPQDPNDEPASVLLERIRAEKERLIAEGKIKRSKKSATSDTSHYENVPFEVPDGWCWCQLDELFLFIRNGKSIKQVKGAGGFPITRIETISNSVIDKERMGYANITDTKGLEEYILRNGDILMSHINSPIHVGKSALCCDISEDEIILHGMNLLCLRPHSGIDSFYLDMYFNSPIFRDLIRPYIKNAVNQASINTQNIGNTYIPVPPLAEQIRISNMYKLVNTYLTDLTLSLEGLTYSISSAKSKILDLAIHGKLVPQDVNDEPASELLKRINPKAITSCDNPQYGKVPSSWVISTVGEVFTINPKTHVEDDTDAAFVPMTCVSDGYSNTFEYECRKWGDIKKGFVHFQENDVAVAKISPCLENRKSVVFHDLPNGIGAGTTELNVFRCAEILPEYALFYFKSQFFICSCAGTYNGVVGQQRVAKSFIQELPIGIPPYKEQQRIVSKVNDLFSQLDMIKKSLQA